MKRFVMILAMVFVLFMSCGTTSKLPKNWDQYLETKKSLIASIETELLNADKYINLGLYTEQIARYYSWNSRGEYNSVYSDDFTEDVYKKYKPIVDAHNDEYARRQKQKDDEWVKLSMKKIPGSRDWVLFQDTYNLRRIYTSMIRESNSVNRLRLETLEREMITYIKDKNLVFNEEQNAWYKQLWSELFNLAFALNVDFGMNYNDFQSYLNSCLARFSRYAE